MKTWDTTARRVAYARKVAVELMEALGWRCELCGTEADLEFDHPHGRDYEPSKLNRWQRMIRYRRDFRAGNLRLLCKECNGRDGAERRHGRRRKGVTT